MRDVIGHVIERHGQNAWNGSLIFRGHSHALIGKGSGRSRQGYRLEPSISRFNGIKRIPYNQRKKCLEEIRESKRRFARLECDLLTEFRAQAKRFLPQAPAESWGWIAIAQHHGIPTRLLDWTSNLLTGLWFAVERNHGGHHPASLWIYESGLDRRYSVKALECKMQRLPKPKRKAPAGGEGFWHHEICPRGKDCEFRDIFDVANTYTIDPGYLIPRMYYQSGLFTLHKFHTDLEKPNSLSFDLVPLEVNAGARGKLEQILIDRSAVEIIRKQLEGLFGMDESRIYPDRLDFIALEVRQSVGDHATTSAA